MNTNWNELSQQQLEQMIEEIQQEIEARRCSEKKKAWEKVKTAIEEYLKIDTIQVENLEAAVYMDNDDSINMDTPGFIEVNF